MLIYDTESILQDRIINERDKEDPDLKRTYHYCYMICSHLLIRDNNRAIIHEEEADFYNKDYSDPSPDFWSYIFSLNNQYKKLYIVSHNSKYDTLIIKALKHLSEHNYNIISVSFSNPFFIQSEKIPDPDSPDKKQELIFFSTTNIFQTSIKKLGDELKLPKLDFDYYVKKPPLDIALKYCKRDVEILYRTLINYFSFLQSENIFQEKITIAGQAFSTYRQKYMPEKTIKINHYKRITTLEREAYHGGRTEVFRRGSFQNIIDIDKNSMYPNVMLKNKYPVEKYAEREFLTKRQLKELLKEFYVISYVYLKNVDLPIFGKIIDGKLCFPTGTFFCALHKPELELALQSGYIDFIGYTIIYKEAYIFQDYIKDFYDKRKEAKKHDSIYALFYKYFLNSLYGKFGQYNIILKRGESIEDKEVIDEFTEVYKDQKTGEQKHRKILIFNGYQWSNETEGESFYSAPAIAGAVTAFGRIEMFKALKTAGFKNIYYMDTDSIFLNEEGYKNIESASLISETELGLFKIEEVCKRIKINNVKDYEYTTDTKTVRKLKGINLNSAKELGAGKYEIDYWSGYSNIIHSRTQDYYTEKRIKEYKDEYTKGILKADGTIKPYHLKENFYKFFRDFKDDAKGVKA